MQSQLQSFNDESTEGLHRGYVQNRQQKWSRKRKLRQETHHQETRMRGFSFFLFFFLRPAFRILRLLNLRDTGLINQMSVFGCILAWIFLNLWLDPNPNTMFHWGPGNWRCGWLVFKNRPNQSLHCWPKGLLMGYMNKLFIVQHLSKMLPWGWNSNLRVTTTAGIVTTWLLCGFQEVMDQ